MKAGNCVSHFRQSRLISGLDVGSGLDTGQTLCMGSRQLDTYLRIYDKAAEQRAKEKLVEGTWIRWEMEWKSERADAVGMALSGLDQDSFQKYIVSCDYIASAHEVVTQLSPILSDCAASGRW